MNEKSPAERPFRPQAGPSRRILLAGAGASLAIRPAFAQQAATEEPARRTLTLAPAKARLKADAGEADLFAAGGAAPGPTIRVLKGQPLELTLENKLSQPTALHIHGLRGPATQQVVPGLAGAPLAPGETRTLRIDTPDAGTFLYLPSLQGRVAEQMERGLAGFFIVEETAPPPVDLDLPLALDDARLDDAGQIAANFNAPLDSARAGRLGNALIVNGKPAPDQITVRPGARIRLRLANFANARVMPMRFEGVGATVVALDGQGCEPFDPLKRTVILVPGSRFDVMIDAPREAGKDGRILVALGAGLPVLMVKTEGEALPARPAVTQLPANTLPGEIRLATAHRAEFAISGGLAKPAPGAPPATAEEAARRFPDRMKIWSLNGGFNTGFGGKPAFTVKRGAVVVLALVNRSDWPQVITLHGHVFRLLHPMDDGWEPYFLDTLYLPEKTTSRIAFDAANPGKWAIRSMVPEHYDAGVASWYEVTP